MRTCLTLIMDHDSVLEDDAFLEHNIEEFL